MKKPKKEDYFEPAFEGMTDAFFIDDRDYWQWRAKVLESALRVYVQIDEYSFSAKAALKLIKESQS